ncbi:F-box protein: endocytic membrane traffic, recycling ReCYcling 1 [Ascosphaera acerosa]|nr:F-box protein: endocytic membrane traffic, recycling ReCYcling 1 [Ascosphaera acerosa]
MPSQSSVPRHDSRDSISSNGGTRLTNPRPAARTKERGPRKDILASLKKMTLEPTSRACLPAELLAVIFDHVGAEDLISVARCSRQFRDMVYDDTRWVRRLKLIGCWDEAEARQEAERQRNLNPHRPDIAPMAVLSPATSAAQLPSVPGGKLNGAAKDGDMDALVHTPTFNKRPLDYQSATTVLENVRSIRGSARQEYGRVHAALAPFYDDVVQSTYLTGSTINQPVAFRTYQTPEQQASILANVEAFAKSDNASGGLDRERRLLGVMSLFERAVLLELQAAYEQGDIEGRMRRYVNVLATLNGGAAAADLFVDQNHMLARRASFGTPSEAVDRMANTVSLQHTHAFLVKVGVAYKEEKTILAACFQQPERVSKRLLDKATQCVIMPYFMAVLDEAHERDVAAYLTAFPALFMQVNKFWNDLDPLAEKDGEVSRATALSATRAVFEMHLDVYFAEELSFFEKQAESAVVAWDKQISDREASEELLYMSNISRQADKKDFMASFKKVLMAPVNILPVSFIAKHHSSPHDTGGSQSPVSAPGTPASPAVPSQSPFAPFPRESPSRASTPVSTSTAHSDNRLPTSELAAKAAIMSARLESIRSLFSIEVALDLVHKGKSSLERMAQFAKLNDPQDDVARMQCEAIFVKTLYYLGHRHVIAGFDKAINHLTVWRSNQSRRGSRTQESSPNTAGVGSLAKFLELVNVGDLIMQMMDVFYEQELIAAGLVSSDDFLAPAVKEKKKFEQRLDERVATGLNKGIDVLVDEIEYVLATKQQVLDYNPEAAGSTGPVDIGPSAAAQEVVNIISNHIKMLQGSIDKSTFDVFCQEVGLRLFGSLCKHLKVQRISVAGAIKLISDMSHYAAFIHSMRNRDLSQYFVALCELAQIYLIAPSDAKEMAVIIADVDRFHGIFRAEEVYEFATRRADWYQVKAKVDSAMYGVGCFVM